MFALEETPLTDRIDDLLIALYGIIGLAVLFVYRAELARFPVLLPYLVAGFALLGFQVLLDAVSNRSEYIGWFGIAADNARTVKRAVMIVEESAKLFAEAAFLSGFVRVLQQARDMRKMTFPPEMPLI